MNKFSERLNYALRHRGMKPIDLAKKSGIGKSSISEWINGKYKAKQDKVFIMAQALDVDEGWLMGLDVPMETNHVAMNDILKAINEVASKLEGKRLTKVLSFTEFQLKEQENKLKEDSIHYLLDYGAVSAGSGELLQEESPVEVAYEGEVPQHDFTVTVNGTSMQPMLQHGERLFIATTEEARVGQIIIANVNNEAYVKKLGEDRLISLNDDSEDIYINEHDHVNIIGIVVL